MDNVGFHARSRPSKLAVKDLAQQRQWTYTEFDRLIASCVSILLEQAISEGDRVACLSKNRAEILVLHLACARLGAIFVPLNWRLSAAEVEWQLANSEPSVFYADDTVQGLTSESQEISGLIPACQSVKPVWPDAVSADLPSLMLYTSGTTGKPKGALVSERNLDELALNFTLLGEVDQHSGFLCESPMFHIIGLNTSIRPALFNGSHIVISDGFIPSRTLDRLANPDLAITHYFCVPQMAVAMRQADNFNPDNLRHLKAIFTGGAPHPAAQIRDWLQDDISIVDGYGSSEAGTVFGMPLDRRIINAKAGSVGVATPRIQARIVDGSGKQVAVGQRGELQLFGANVARNYWRREEDYKASLSEDGWFCTGDIVTVDEDGFYRIVDRKKDMFISGGENVYPAEIEALLVKLPGVRELAVTGVPDEKWGEVGCVFYDADSDISLENMKQFLAGNLAKYKVPQKALKVDAIPRNGAGKVLKPALKQIYLETL